MILGFFRRAIGRTITLGIPLISAVAVAQAPVADVCATIVQDALRAANNACSSTSRNQVCYGNVQGAATPADGVTDLVFEDVGDIVGLTQIKALQLSPLNEADNQWGVALMQLQATLPDTLPGQNVTFLMFGDVTVEDNTGDQVHVDGMVLNAANLRLAPSMTGPILGSLPQGATIVGTGKTVNAAGERWVRLRYEDYRTKTGWMLAELIDIDFTALPDVASDSLTYSPMQAFYFKTGIGQTQCADAPVSGVLVQTPQGAGKVNFNINGIDIALGSTAFLTAPEGENNTCLSLLTGDMDVSASGSGQNANPGERVCVPMNEDGSPGKPLPPEPFDAAELGSIAPIMNSMPDEVEIPDPAPERTPTPFPPTAAPTAVPTNVPAPTSAPPQPQVPTPIGTEDPNPPLRYVFIDVTQVGMTLSLNLYAAVYAPDTPSSFSWEVNGSPIPGNMQSFTLELSPGTPYNAEVEVCWPDDDCVMAYTSGYMPE